MDKKPEPFLQRPFGRQVRPVITEGWYYSEEETQLHGATDHQSIDFAMPLGTPILAAADGLAVASFTEVPVPNKDGSHRQWKGKPIYFGAGLMIKIFHPNGWCTLYGHLHRLGRELIDASVYYPPIQEVDGGFISKNISVSQNEVGRNVKALPVKAGQVIAYSGITGMGWGRPTYADWLAGKPYEVCDEEHLRFQVSFSELNKKDEYESIDPFGMYKQNLAYPGLNEDWSLLADSLWLPENN